jgi:cell fate regulator YaaT (PSP1 superfamily)
MNETINETMKIVGVRFKPDGKTYDFDCGPFVLKEGDEVIVNTDQGLGFGAVARPPVKMAIDPSRPALKKIYRLANEKDRLQIERNAEIEKEAHAFCEAGVAELGLNMNLFSVESSFDGGKLVFFFTADGRVDFRQLVKKLVKQFKTRIEMRQVGIRNQAKMCGGLGRCGREPCCSSFTNKFEPISIRMAKQQGLSLNPTKISGQCGRLMCCLTFENETYRQLMEELPRIGAIVRTAAVRGKVVRQNVIGSRLSLIDEEGNEIEVSLKDLIPDEPVREKESS